MKDCLAQITVERLAGFGIVVNEHDMGIRFAVDNALQIALAKTNHEHLPKGLYMTVADMACGFYLKSAKAWGKIDESIIDFTAPAKSIKEGDVTITLADSSEGVSSPEKRFDIAVETLINPSPAIFYKYRKVKW